MTPPRGSSEHTKNEILKAARELFAERGINLVSIRDIGAAAGVNHALVHRYFGTKEEMVAEIIRRECEALKQHPPEVSTTTPEAITALRRLLVSNMTDARTTLRLIARAELTGLEPEKMIEGTARPLGLLSAWIRSQQSRAEIPSGERTDPALVSVLVGGALFSMATVAPWLMTAVGLQPEDAEIRRDEMVELLVDIVARAAGLERAGT